jgi:uncharacterized delta-60 repeat protein
MAGRDGAPGPPAVLQVVGVLLAVVLLGALAAARAGAAAGDLDTGFSDDGKAWTRIGYPYGETGLNAVALQGRKIIAAGADIGAGGLTVARFKPSGKLDKSFSENGSVTLKSTSASPADVAFSVAVQPDRRIVVAGQIDQVEPYSEHGHFVVARFKPNGRPDRSFSGNGSVRFGPGAASDVAITRNGKVVVAGTLGPDAAVVRLRPRGVPDSKFSGDGVAITDFGYAEGEELSALALQPDGRTVVAGTGTRGYDEDYGDAIREAILARYTRDGELDPSFSNDARTLNPRLISPSDLALQPDGAIVAAGDAIARFDADGRLDPTFGDGGVAPGSFAEAVALQRDGSIIAASAVYPDETDPNRWGTDFFLARFTPSGAPDPSFSEDGTVTTDFFGRPDAVKALALQGHKKVIAAGYADEGQPGSVAGGFALARYRLAD